MLRKNYFVYLTAVALFFLSGTAIFAQTAPIRGKVELKKADGTTAPLSGAVIDVYVMDSKAKAPSNKTDKKGTFGFAGLQLGQTYMFAVSAPGAQSQVFPNIKPGQDNLIFTMYEGDGKKLTEDEARQTLIKKPAAAAPADTAAATAPSSEAKAADSGSAKPPTKEEIEAAKKAQAEYEKKKAEIESRNAKVTNINKVVEQALSEGKAAFDAKNYELAAAKYQEGINADPDFAGTATVFNNNRGLALKLRGFDNYKKSTTDAAGKTALMESAKKDFSDAIANFQRTLALVKANSTTDAKLQKDYATYRRVALTELIETHRLMVGSRADQTRGKEALAAIEEYSATETEPAVKAKTLLAMADTLRSAGDSENAVPIYRKIMEISPDNIEAMGGLGLSLVNIAAASAPPDKAMMQEALNLLDRFAQGAPDTHPLKADVKGVSDYLKNTEKLAPQKTSRPAKKKT